ncbi:MAG: class I SAM-dependent methyltransferase [Paracoccaceae bacterium]
MIFINPKPATLTIDFTTGAVDHRRRFGGGRGQALPRAVGMKSGPVVDVVDATAGLGRDAFLLASLGTRVTLIERSEKMHSLLAGALAHARKAGGDIADVIDRMTLLHGDARDLLPGLNPQVVLVDPMHPPRNSSALVKREMRLLREIVGTDEDSVTLMQIALKTARKRVVLKWPLRADPMAGIGPASHQILGKSTRFDVYMIG